MAVFINGKPSWDTNNRYVLAGYQRLGEFGEALGLNWDGRWTSPVDSSHVEMTLACSAAKVARRRGREIPAFVAPSSISPLQALSRYLAPSWCPPGDRVGVQRGSLDRIAWTVPITVCQLPALFYALSCSWTNEND